jgi:hypothetical protein
VDITVTQIKASFVFVGKLHLLSKRPICIYSKFSNDYFSDMSNFVSVLCGIFVVERFNCNKTEALIVTDTCWIFV